MILTTRTWWRMRGFYRGQLFRTEEEVADKFADSHVYIEEGELFFVIIDKRSETPQNRDNRQRIAKVMWKDVVGWMPYVADMQFAELVTDEQEFSKKE